MSNGTLKPASASSKPLAGWLGQWARAVGEHHGRVDAPGTLTASTAEDPLAARIVAVADAFDVMTSLRSYKRPMSLSDARKELAACAGKQFDPQVVRAMLLVSLGRLWPAMGPLSWLAQVPVLAGTPPVALPLTVGTVNRALVIAGAVQTVVPALVNDDPDLILPNSDNRSPGGRAGRATAPSSTQPESNLLRAPVAAPAPPVPVGAHRANHPTRPRRGWRPPRWGTSRPRAS